MHPYQHAKLSEKRWGGSWRDYMPIHELVDLSASAYPDMRHRMVLHHVDLGATVVRDILTARGYIAPPNPVDPQQRPLNIREIVRMHVIEDLGAAVSVSQWVNGWVIHQTRNPLRDLRSRYCIADSGNWWDMILTTCRKRWGGEATFYIDLMRFFGARDGDVHATVMMNSFGAHLAELRFGVMYEAYEKAIPVKDVADHMIRSWWRGYYPSLHDLAVRMKLEPWMRGRDIITKGGYKKVIKAHSP